jgi:hypothetical protein
MAIHGSGPVGAWYTGRLGKSILDNHGGEPMARRAVPGSSVDEVLRTCRRRCCLCFGLNADLEVKYGQIAHLDGDPSNNAIANLAFMCLEHHAMFDSRSTQVRRITIPEAKRYRSDLEGHLSRVHRHLVGADDQVQSSEDLLRLSRTAIRQEIGSHVGPKFVGSLDSAGGVGRYVKRAKAEKAIGEFLDGRKVLYESINAAAAAMQRLGQDQLGERLSEALVQLNRGSSSGLVPLLEDCLMCGDLPAQSSIKRALRHARPVFLIKDRAGSGKTNLLCKMALDSIDARGKITLFVACGSLTAHTVNELDEAIADRLGVGSIQALVDHTLRMQDELGEVVLFLDAINENPEIGIFPRVLRALIDRYRNTAVKFIVSCRNVYWAPFSRLRWDDVLFREYEHELYRFSEGELRQALAVYFDHYKIATRVTGAARQKCRHPLLLRFFCETYGDARRKEPLLLAGGMKEVDNIRLKDLFDDYLSVKLGEVQGRARSGLYDSSGVLLRLYDIVKVMREKRQRSVPKGDLQELWAEDIYSLDSIYAAVLDEDIVLEEGLGRDDEPRVYFVYEEFMEYLAAREIIYSRQWMEKSAGSVVAELEEVLSDVGAFVNLFGIIEYISLMLVERRELDVWQMLTERGSDWNTAVVSAIRKVEVTQLDDRAVEAAVSIYKRAGQEKVATTAALDLLSYLGRYVAGDVRAALVALLELELVHHSVDWLQVAQVIETLAKVPGGETVTALGGVYTRALRSDRLRRLVLHGVANFVRHRAALPFLEAAALSERDKSLQRMAVGGILRLARTQEDVELLRALSQNSTLERVAKAMVREKLATLCK